jgi:cyclic pyranopterin phosphate synthase
MSGELSHVDSRGHCRMVDVGGKPVTLREASAEASITMKPETLRLIMEHGVPKGDVLAVARVAGIMAAKNTPSLIPLCHTLNLGSVEIDFGFEEAPAAVKINAVARLEGKTGAEMEALTAVSVAALTIYDMCKAVDREMTIGGIRLMNKKGGKSGEFTRKPE